MNQRQWDAARTRIRRVVREEANNFVLSIAVAVGGGRISVERLFALQLLQGLMIGSTDEDFEGMIRGLRAHREQNKS